MVEVLGNFDFHTVGDILIFFEARQQFIEIDTATLGVHEVLRHLYHPSDALGIHADFLFGLTDMGDVLAVGFMRSVRKV